VWARRPEAAEALAARFETVAHARFDELIDRCEAVAFAVPPAAQAELATKAAEAGRAVLLDKPLAADLDGARRLAAAVRTARVASQMVLIMRYSAPVRSFLAEAAELGPIGGQATWVSGAQLNPSPRPSWRRERGALLDVGPHVIDLLQAALGPIGRLRARGEAAGFTALVMDHDASAVSTAALCARVPGLPARVRFDVFGERGTATLQGPPVPPGTWTTLLGELAAAVRQGGGHPLDAEHGLRLQEVIARAEAQLRDSD
jgi:predicted dehydrogenase